MAVVNLLRVVLRHDRMAAGISIGAFVLVFLPYLDRPFIDSHTFRQSMNAWWAENWVRQGWIDLLHPVVPVFGPDSAVPLDFPVFSGIGAVLIGWGIGVPVAMRLVGLVSFAVGAYLLHRVVRLLGGRALGLCVHGAYLLSPLSLRWASTATVDLLAVAAALGGLFAAIRWYDLRKMRWWSLGTFLIALGLLIKPSVGPLLFALPLLRRPGDPFGASLRRWLTPAGISMAAIPVVLVLGWTAWADAVKVANPLAAYQATSRLFAWHYGTLTQRLDPMEWAPIVGRAFLRGAPGVLPLAALGAVFGLRLVRRQSRPALAALAASAGVAPLIFFNVFVIHDYYQLAMLPGLAITVGLAARWALVHRPVLLVLGCSVWVVVSLAIATYWTPSLGLPTQDESNVLAIARRIDELTDPENLVALVAGDWNPAYFFYAERRGWMIDSSHWRTDTWPGGVPAMVARACADGYLVLRVVPSPSFVEPVRCP